MKKRSIYVLIAWFVAKLFVSSSDDSTDFVVKPLFPLPINIAPSSIEVNPVPPSVTANGPVKLFKLKERLSTIILPLFCSTETTTFPSS